MQPIVNGLEKQFEGRIEFVYINILEEENLELMEQYGFQSTPEFYLVDGEGKVLHTWLDAFTEEEGRDVLASWLTR